MAPNLPQMTPKAPIWWESTENVSRTPFQYKRIDPASWGQKSALQKNWGARWRRAPQGALSAFSPHYIFCICLWPLWQKRGSWGPAPAVGADFSGTRNFGPKYGPSGDGWPSSWKIVFGMCSLLDPQFVYQFLSRHLHPRLRFEGPPLQVPHQKYLLFMSIISCVQFRYFYSSDGSARHPH